MKYFMIFDVTGLDVSMDDNAVFFPKQLKMLKIYITRLHILK